MSSRDAMTATGTGANTTWHKMVQYEDHYRNIRWEDLRDIARDHYKWVRKQDYAKTSGGTCLVAALWVPSNAGGWIFLSTIPRGQKQADMRRYGPREAPAWWSAYGGNPGIDLHAEDAVEFDFERTLSASSNPYVGVVNNEYTVQDRDNPLSRPKMLAWGTYAGDSREHEKSGRPIELCTASGNKTPSCRNVAGTLNIDYSLPLKVEQERQAAQPEYSYRGGGGRGAGGGHGGSSSGSGRRDPQSRMPDEPRRDDYGRGSYDTRDPRYGGPSGGQVDQLTGRMSSLSVSSGENEYWTYSSRDDMYYHKHKSGRVTWSQDGGERLSSAGGPSTSSKSKSKSSSSAKPSKTERPSDKSSSKSSSSKSKSKSSSTGKSSSKLSSKVEWKFSKTENEWYYKDKGNRVYADEC